MGLREQGLLEVTINKVKQEIESTQQLVFDDDGKIIPNYFVECFL